MPFISRLHLPILRNLKGLMRIAQHEKAYYAHIRRNFSTDTNNEIVKTPFWKKKTYGKKAQHRLQLSLAFSLFIVLVGVPTGWAFAKMTIPKMKNHAILMAEVEEQQKAFEVCISKFLRYTFVIIFLP